MAHLYTITANTAIDNVITVHAFKVGEVFRSENTANYPSGKGINVARTIESLGHQVTALGFIGQSSESQFKELISEKLDLDLIVVEGDTRTNITIFDPINHTKTHIQNTGYEVDGKDLIRLENILRKRIMSGDIVVISGSLPLHTQTTAYEHIINVCHERDALVILDSSNDYLAYGIRAKPFMIKPNIGEFEKLIGRDLGESESNIVKATQDIINRGVSLVVVSRGKEGIIVTEKNGTSWKAWIDITDPLMTTIGVGSGDSLVGGFAVGLKEKKSLVDTIRLGVACGAANLFSLIPGSCSGNRVKRYSQEVKVEQI